MKALLLAVTVCLGMTANAQVIPPYSTGFEGVQGTLNTNFPEGWTWEDLNTVPFGNQGWEIIKNTPTITNAHTDSTAAHMFSHSSEQNNDWLFTPGMQLQGGVPYTFSFWYSVASLLASSEKLAIKKGSAPTALAMGTPLWINTAITNQEYEQATFTYTPAADEVTYFAFHYFSEEFQFILLVDDVSITSNFSGMAELANSGSRIWMTNDLLNVEVDRMAAGSLLMINDVSGRLVLQQQTTNKLETIDVGTLPSGTYLAHLFSPLGKSVTKRFVIAH